MAKFYGEIGFVQHAEVPEGSGIWKETLTKRNYYGDVVRYARRLSSDSERVNDTIVVDNVISIVADPYANDHFFAIRYVKWQNTRWKVTNVEIQYPRLQLTIGGVYNGPTD